MAQTAKTMRQAAGFSQHDLAARLAVTRNVIANLETGRRGLYDGELFMIAYACRIPFEMMTKQVLFHFTVRRDSSILFTGYVPIGHRGGYASTTDSEKFWASGPQPLIFGRASKRRGDPD